MSEFTLNLWVFVLGIQPLIAIVVIGVMLIYACIKVEQLWKAELEHEKLKKLA